MRNVELDVTSKDFLGYKQQNKPSCLQNKCNCFQTSPNSVIPGVMSLLEKILH